MVYSEDVLTYLPEDEQEFRWRFGLDADTCPDHMQPEEWEHFQELRGLAKLFLQFAEQLSSGEADAVAQKVERLVDETHELNRSLRASDEETRHFIFTEEEGLQEVGPTYEITSWEFVREVLNFTFSRRELRRATEMTNRVKDLLGLLIETGDERTRAYLSRVAQCYLLGLETEGLVMCRSVLEAACERVTVADTVVRERNTTNDPSLSDRLKYLRFTRQVFEHDTYDQAMAIKDRGNLAVHDEPEKTGLAETLHDLRDVLTELSSLPSQDKA